MKRICYHPGNQRVNISGVGNHLINDKRLASFCAVISMDTGPKLGIWHNYVYVPEQQGTIQVFKLKPTESLFPTPQEPAVVKL